MDQILLTLLSWQFVLLGLSIAAITFVIRKIVEYVMATSKSAAKEDTLWENLILPILPVVLGLAMCALFAGLPYPVGIITVGGRAIFGLVAGLMSTLLYRIINALFAQKINAVIAAMPVLSSATTTVTSSTVTSSTPTAPTAPTPTVPEAPASVVLPTTTTVTTVAVPTLAPALVSVSVPTPEPTPEPVPVIVNPSEVNQVKQ